MWNPKVLVRKFLNSEGEWAFLNTPVCLLRCIPELPNSLTCTQILIASAVCLLFKENFKCCSICISLQYKSMMKMSWTPWSPSLSVLSARAQDIKGEALTCPLLASVDRLAAFCGQVSSLPRTGDSPPKVLWGPLSSSQTLKGLPGVTSRQCSTQKLSGVLPSQSVTLGLHLLGSTKDYKFVNILYLQSSELDQDPP